MFLEQNPISKNSRHRLPRLRIRHWLPMLIVPVAACLAAPDTSSSNLASTKHAFTGRDVPSSHAITPNGQLTWTPSVNGTPHKHIAVSPDGAFYLHAEGKNDATLYLSLSSLKDMMVSNDSINFDDYADSEPIMLNPWLDSNTACLVATTSTLGGLGAVSFDPRYGVGYFHVASTANCENATSVANTAVFDDSIECYRMIVYAQTRDETCTETKYRVAVAPMYVAINRDEDTVAAEFTGPFTRIEDSNGNFVDARTNSEDNDNFSDHFSATADGRLIVFRTTPFYAWSADPLAPDSFTVPRSFWSITNNLRAKPTRLHYDPSAPVCTQLGGDCVRFDQAYPVFAQPFRFSNGTAIDNSVATCDYPWITPDGTDLFCNAGRISTLAMIGQSTHGTLQHIDAQVQTTQQRFCKIEAVNNKSCTKSPSAGGAFGKTECSPRGDDGCGGGTPTPLGTQRITSIGAAAGPWKARTAMNGDTTRFPLMHRAPSLLMMSRNTALAAFGNDPTAKNASFLYFEVATDAAVDPDFVAFFHMNEAIMPDGALGVWDRASPFADTDPSNGVGADATADAGGLGYFGTLTDAEFPFDRFGQKEHSSNAPPNPGFLGRAIYFQMPGGKVDIAKTSANTVNRLAEGRSAMTLELAVQPIALGENTGNTVLLAAPGSYELSFNRSTQSVTFAATGATSTATFGSLANDDGKIDDGKYTHLALTYQGHATKAEATVTLYRNGLLVGTKKMSGANSLPPAPDASPLCIGPGCCMSAACTPPTSPAGAELLIDEVGISSVVRTDEYMAAAASVDGPTDVFDPADSPSSYASWFEPLPPGLPAEDRRVPKEIVDLLETVPNPANRVARIARIGEALFNHDVLSVSEDNCGGKTSGRSCAFCHREATYFAHPSANPGEKFDPSVPGTTALEKNTPSLLNRAFSTRQLGDRSAASLLEQANLVIENPNEMGGTLSKIRSCLNQQVNPEAIPVGFAPTGITTYRQWFNDAFADDRTANNAITNKQILGALALYELTLVSGNSAVDQMLAPGGTGSATVREGLLIFQGKGRCAGCHSGKNFTDELRHVTSFGGKAIKTPSLRNVEHTMPYFQNGSKANLAAVVAHYNRCGAAGPNDPCAPELVALGLTDPEIDALVAFLQGLSSLNP